MESNSKAIRKVLEKILKSFYVGGDGYHYSRLDESDYQKIKDAFSQKIELEDRVKPDLSAPPELFFFKGQISSAVFERIRNLKSGTVKYADLEGWNSQYNNL